MSYITLTDYMKNKVLERAYPIGSIVITDKNANDYFPGTWEIISNKFLLNQTPSHPLGEVRGKAFPTVPEHTHTVTIADHIHSIDHTHAGENTSYPYMVEIIGDIGRQGRISLPSTSSSGRYFWYINHDSTSSEGPTMLQKASTNNEDLMNIGILESNSITFGSSNSSTKSDPPYKETRIWERVNPSLLTSQTFSSFTWSNTYWGSGSVNGSTYLYGDTTLTTTYDIRLLKQLTMNWSDGTSYTWDLSSDSISISGKNILLKDFPYIEEDEDYNEFNLTSIVAQYYRT